MADKTIDNSFITLIDNWPGEAKPLSIPNFKLGVANWTYQNVPLTTPGRPKLGSKYLIYNDASQAKGVAGYATLIYLKLGTQNPDTALAAKLIVAPDSATAQYQVSNDKNTVLDVTGCPLIAVALGAMTDGYGGYFWCGGVCPADIIYSGATYVLDGNYLTDSTVAIGAMQIVNAEGENIAFAVLAATGGAIGTSGSLDAA